MGILFWIDPQKVWMNLHHRKSFTTNIKDTTLRLTSYEVRGSESIRNSIPRKEKPRLGGWENSKSMPTWIQKLNAEFPKIVSTTFWYFPNSELDSSSLLFLRNNIDASSLLVGYQLLYSYIPYHTPRTHIFQSIT